MIRVAACQVQIDIDAPERTRAAVASAVVRAAEAEAELVVLPELALTGYVFADAAEALTRAEELDGPGIRFFCELSGDFGLMLVAGWCEKSTRGRPYNSAVVIDHGVVVGCYRKTHLWGRETEVFAAGDKAPPVLATTLGLIAPVVCYDLEFPEVVRAAALGGAELIVAPSNWPRGLVPLGERPIEVIKAQAAAAVNRVGVIVADRCGSERGQDWTGASLISGPDGYLLAGPASGEETVLLADIDLADCTDKRLGLYNDALADRRPHLYTEPHR